ncbi:acyl-CoA synthetase [Streptosporangium album]|uniref:Acyl-CoA synthetase n=1 Tax=Streptosporangium album TaxID=47479 RepID=A0A7W7S5D3_9ACTN|nr:AMP-binding protein [Streptosporangium album]MBB4944184.1 acyl-CoA synthetase [Streptosporangium album]
MGSFEFAPAPEQGKLTSFYDRNGYQSPALIAPLMRRNKREFGALPAVFDGEVTLTWRELIDAAARFAGFLSSRGVGPGDVVTWQVPNWWESLVVAYGIWAAGAISSPVVPIYREHELRAVLAAVRPACVVAPEEFRGRRHTEMIEEACRASGWQPAVRVVLRGRATGWTPFGDAMAGRGHLADGRDPDEPALVGFTSGTTSGAKGVVHSVRSFIASPLRSSRMMPTGWTDRSYMPAPVAHATGMLSAIAVPLFTGSSIVLRDRWDAEQAIDDIARYAVTSSAGAAVFIQELLDALDGRGMDRLALPGGYPCGGSSIPTSLAEAAEARGLIPARSFGMTECPGVTGSSPRLDPPEIRLATDGWVAAGCEVRVVGMSGEDVAVGEAGEFWIRGPQMALGYIDPEHTREGFDEAGWFRTGDLGRLQRHDVGDGEVRYSATVTGRVKEIINRGGEKISAREIEDVLVRHPAVAEAAVVSAPHDRLGEQPAAFVLFRPEIEVGFEDLAAFLKSTGLAPQKIPQVWRHVHEMPRTASGKVMKHVLQSQFAKPPVG